VGAVLFAWISVFSTVLAGMNTRLRCYKILNEKIFQRFVPFSLLVGVEVWQTVAQVLTRFC
jgi:hypothetical protein